MTPVVGPQGLQLSRMSARLAWSIGGILAAGCLGPSPLSSDNERQPFSQPSPVFSDFPPLPTPDERVESPTPASGEGAQRPFSFGAPFQVTDFFGGEPRVAADSRGTIYVAPEDRIFRSRDDGQSFQAAAHPQGVMGDGWLVVDPDDRLYLAYMTPVAHQVIPRQYWTHTITIWTSTDGAESWQESLLRLDGNVPYADRPWIATGKNGVAYFSYHLIGQPVVVRHVMGKTTDGGLTWAPVPGAQDLSGAVLFPMVDKRDNTLYVIEVEYPGAIYLARSEDAGITFHRTLVADRHTNVHYSFVVGTVDETGNVYVTWADNATGQFDVFLAVSVDRGATWKPPLLVSSAPGTHIFPWVAAGQAGEVALAWYGANKVTKPDTPDADLRWYVYAARSLNANSDQPGLSYAFASPGPVHEGGVCVTGSGEGCQTDRDLLDYLMVTITPSGRAAVAYTNDLGTPLNETTYYQGVSTMFALEEGGSTRA